MGRNLHDTDYIFQPKRGLAANLNTTANKNSAVDGEIAYTTDRKQLWIFNGTEYEEVNKYTQYFYNSSEASPSGNRFADWAAMQDSIGGREVRVQFEQDETIPAGAWTIDYQTWVGNGQNPDGGGLTITFPTGVTLSSALNWTCENGLNLHSTSTAPIYTMTVPHIFFFNRTAIYTDTVEFVKVTCNGLVAVGCLNGFGMYNDGAGLGSYEVFNIDSSAYGTILVTTEQGVAATIQDNTIRSAVPIVYGWLKQSSEATAGFATQANLDAGSVNFNGVPGGDGGALFANAKVVGFIEGQPTDIASTNVYDAFAEVRALLEFDVYTPTITGVTNVTSSTAYQCQYNRVGDVVTVSGQVGVTATANNAETTIGISLPIASNFGNSYECGGTAYKQANTNAGHGAAIYADATNDRAEMDYYETHGAEDIFSFQFTYKVI